MDTIPVEEFAGAVKTAFVTFFTDLIYGALVAEVPAFAAPVLGPVTKWIIKQAVTFAATKGGLVLFMINSGIFTSSQAQDFNEAVRRLNNLPEDVTDDEWDQNEQKVNQAFRNLWNLTR